MRNYLASLIAFILLTIVLGSNTRAYGNAGVFTGNGQSLHQITSKSVQLVTIDVTIVLGRGRFLFDGTVPGMDQAYYRCTFVLRSLSDKDEDVQVGFPVDSQFAENHGKEDQQASARESRDWVLQYAFIARDEKRTYHIEFVHRKKSSAPDDFAELFTWSMRFAPKETRTLTVQYSIPITMGLTSTRTNEMEKYNFSSPLEMEFVNIADIEEVGYITSTGSSWASNVENATFTVITEPFEQYMSSRGWAESPEAGMTPEEAAQFTKSRGSFESSMTAKQAADFKRSQPLFPVAHPWWFRQISPAGWKSVDHGVQWSYRDYKPKDAIGIRYYQTQLPRLAEEVDPFVDRYVKSLRAGVSVSTELRRLKQLILATYGKEPEDPVVKLHASGQVWYTPRKDFSVESLTATQKNILTMLDRRIAAAAPE